MTMGGILGDVEQASGDRHDEDEVIVRYRYVRQVTSSYSNNDMMIINLGRQTIL